jgi:hypothetical protein
MRQQIGVVLVLALLALTLNVKDSAPLLAGGGRPPVTLSLPASTTVSPGDTFTLTISLDMEPDSHAISIVTLVLAFDPTVLKVTDFSPANVLPAVLESSLGTDTAGLTAGTGIDPAGAIKSSTTVATITFQAVGSGELSTPISFTRAEAYSLSSWDEASENVVGATTDASITISGQAKKPPPPAAEGAIDLFMVVDLSSSYADDLSNFQAQARGIISALKASNADFRVGLARFEDYPIPPFGSAGDKAYERLVDLTSDTDLVLNTIATLSIRSGSDDPESQLPALFQAATGAGQDLSGAGFSAASIPPGQQANFRDGATKLFLLWTDASFHLPGDSGNIPYPGPSVSETVNAILALDPPKVIGISSGGGGLSDLQAIARATDALAPPGGVDCDNNRAIDIPEGEPLVCTIAASGEGISAAIRALVGAATTPPNGTEATITVPGNQPWTDTGLDLNQGDQVTITASGTIKIAPEDPGKTPAGDPSCVGPTGRKIDPTSETWLTPGLTCWSLVGRIGEDGALFEVGTSLGFPVETAGRLYLGVNDETGRFGNNSGSWTVDIIVSDAAAETDLTANAGADQTVPGPSPVAVQFDGSGSTGDIVRYLWYNQYGLLRAEGVTPVIDVNFGYTDPQPGTQRTFTLVVEDSQGNTVQDEVTITLGEIEESDTEPPTISWVKPVGNDAVYQAASGTIDLEVDASDSSGIRLVEFLRWGGPIQQEVEIGTDSSPPYQASLEVNTLNIGENGILAVAVDTAGNRGIESISIYRQAPTITLDPTEGPPGTEVTATGSGWPAGHEVSVQWEDGTELATPAVADNGDFTVSFTVPDDAAEGQHPIDFVSFPPEGEAYVISASFTVTAPSGTPPPKEPEVYQHDFPIIEEYTQGETGRYTFEAFDLWRDDSNEGDQNELTGGLIVTTDSVRWYVRTGRAGVDDFYDAPEIRCQRGTRVWEGNWEGEAGSRDGAGCLGEDNDLVGLNAAYHMRITRYPGEEGKTPSSWTIEIRDATGTYHLLAETGFGFSENEQQQITAISGTSCADLLELPPADNADSTCQPDAQPTITLDPAEGPPETEVTATGSGWSGGHAVSVQWEDGTVLGTTTVDDNGDFTVFFTVPDNAAEGEYTINFVGAPPDGEAYTIPATFTVTPPGAPSFGPAGSFIPFGCNDGRLCAVHSRPRQEDMRIPTIKYHVYLSRITKGSLDPADTEHEYTNRKPGQEPMLISKMQEAFTGGFQKAEWVKVQLLQLSKLSELIDTLVSVAGSRANLSAELVMGSLKRQAR